MRVNISQRETGGMVQNIVSDVSVVTYVNISQEVSDERVIIPGVNISQDERGKWV